MRRLIEIKFFAEQINLNEVISIKVFIYNFYVFNQHFISKI